MHADDGDNDEDYIVDATDRMDVNDVLILTIITFISNVI